MRAKVTAKDVAELARVHPGTVSRVLNPKTRHLVAPQTARRVDRAARTLGYQANPIARGLRTRRSYTIGIVIPDLTNPLFPPIVRGVEDCLGPAGYAALLFNTDSDPEQERRGLATLIARQVDGVIAASAAADSAGLRNALAAGEALVLINRHADELPVCAVVPDDRRGVRLGVEHLLGLGHRRIAHLAGPPSISTTRDRAASFVETLRAHGIDAPDALIARADALKVGSGVAPMRRLLETGLSFTAVCAGNDLLALDCIDVLRESGLRCPEDVSVVGFNDMPFAERFAPPLTTLRFPHYEMGRSAAEMLLEQIDGRTHPARTVVLDTELVVRGSTAPPPAAR